MIVKADFPAGLTIEQAIADALEFAENNKCMVSAELNDIPMVFSGSPIFGNTREERIKTFAEKYRHALDKQYQDAIKSIKNHPDETGVADCPFCGSESVAESGDSKIGVWWVQVRCTKCKAKMSDTYNPKEDWKTREERLAELIADWNKRV